MNYTEKECLVASLSYSTEGWCANTLKDGDNSIKTTTTSGQTKPLLFPHCQKLIDLFENHTEVMKKPNVKTQPVYPTKEQIEAPIVVDEKQNGIDKPNHESHSDSSTEHSNETHHINVKTTKSEIRKLPRTKGLHNLLERALGEIDRLSIRKEKEKNNNNDNGKEEKDDEKKSKENKRKKNEVPEKQTVTDDSKSDDTKTNREDLNGRSDNGDHQKDALLPEYPASTRIQITLDSIRAVLPIFHYILTHPDTNNKSLTMTDGTYLSKKKQVFIFTKSCYDVSTQGAMKTIRNRFGLLFPNPDICQTIDIGKILNKAKRIEDDGEIISLTLYPFLKTSVSCLIDDNFETARMTFDNNDYNLQPLLQMGTDIDDYIFKTLVADCQYCPFEQEKVVKRLHSRLDNVLQSNKKFKDAKLTVYGSSASGLSLDKSDVDLSLFMPSIHELKQDLKSERIGTAEYDRQLKNTMYKLKRTLESKGLVDVQVIARARVPVVKGSDYNTNFDICFLNEIAVKNSGLISEYSKLDNRVKLLMLTIKKWAKTQGVASAADSTLSCYTWINLVIFYLQCINFVPNLQCKDLMKTHGLYISQNDLTNGLDTSYLSSKIILESPLWKRSEDMERMPTVALLHGFFTFYAYIFPQSILAVSIRLGKCCLLKTAFKKVNLWRFCIEDPFETYYSHFVHDLGIHLNEGGQMKINCKLKEAASKMEAACRSMSSTKITDGDIKNFIKNISSIWLINSDKANTIPKSAPNNRKQGKREKHNVNKDKKNNTSKETPSHRTVSKHPKLKSNAGHHYRTNTNTTKQTPKDGASSLKNEVKPKMTTGQNHKDQKSRREKQFKTTRGERLQVEAGGRGARRENRGGGRGSRRPGHPGRGGQLQGRKNNKGREEREEQDRVQAMEIDN